MPTVSPPDSPVARAQAAVEAKAEGGAERRMATFDRVEMRAKDDPAQGYTFTGHAAVFDELSDDLGGGLFGSFREVFKRGAFKDVLAGDTWFLYNHDPNFVLARTTSGTLRMKEDPKGLKVEADVAPTSYAADLRILIERGDVSQMSFAFQVGSDGEQEWHEDDEGNVTRTVKRVSALPDVSAVIYPAYPQTDASVRNLCGVEVDVTSPDRDQLVGLAWTIHRGEKAATVEERATLDRLLEQFSTVTPWMAERSFRAAGEEPELLAAIPGYRAHVELVPEPDGGVPWDTELRGRELRLRARFVR